MSQILKSSAPSETAVRENPPIIQVDDLTKEFNGNAAVSGVTFSVQPGVIFGFIGPSGSGKTTTIRLLTGIIEPTRGEARVFERTPTKFTRRDRERIGYMPQQFVLYPDLSVWENMNFAASIYGVGLFRGKRLKEQLDFVELTEHRRKLARQVSGGMQRRLSLAATLIHKPNLIFLDEPTAGVDPVLRRKFWDHFRELQSQGATLFITTQYVSEAVYCDLVGVMIEGRLLAVDTPKNLRIRAIGGEMVDLRTKPYIEYHHIENLRDLPFVTGEVQRKGENEVRIIVDKASTAIPQLVEWTKAQQLPIDSIHEYFPPFDDIFVTLIEERGDDH
jgi:ABC-2 type transport system ATP-binding protein